MTGDDRQRELVVEEVAEAEVALADLSLYSGDDLAAMNDQLGKLRTQATSLGLPTQKIDQLKLRVASALGKADPTALGYADPKKRVPGNPGPRGKEKVYPVRKEKTQPTNDRTKAVEDLFK